MKGKFLTEDPVRRKGTKRMKCECYQRFQDERYGLRVRIHNRMGIGGKEWRCTGCGTVKRI